MKEYIATCTFTARDVALYAVSVGYGSSWESYTQDLRYIWEKHDNFAIVPTYAFSLLFWSIPHTEHGDNGSQQVCPISLPEFPCPMMKQMGLIPPTCILSKDIKLHEYPVIHTRQSISWHSSSASSSKGHQIFRNGAFCCTCRLKARFLSVQPKSIGTFVTTETLVEEQSSGFPLYTLRSTALILDLDETLVSPMKNDEIQNDEEIKSSNAMLRKEVRQKRKPSFEKDLHIATNQALLYRLASGDSNSIHVDPSTLPEFFSNDEGENHETKKPLVHGLATLAVATRTIEQCLFEQVDSTDFELLYMDASFTKPVFLGEMLRLRGWWADMHKAEKMVVFHVVKVNTNEICIDHGWAKIRIGNSKSRL